MNDIPSTTGAADVPFALLFGLIVVLLVRGGELRAWVAVVCGLFGFYLANSGAAPVINGVTTYLVTGLLHTN